jgi:predicted negative regulator of RcsB-dependent stress response
MAKQDRYTAPRQTTEVTNTLTVNNEEDVYIPSADEQLDKVKNFYDSKKNIINYLIGGLLLAVIGWFAYSYFVKGPNEIKASDELSMANTFMLMDSTNLMVNGDGKFMGAAKVADKFGGTKAGNLACYMAGVGSLKLGKTKDAIKYLEKFDGTGSVLATIATGSLGDAYWEDKQLDKATSCYEKAGADEDNFQFAPMYLQRAGMIYEQQNKKKEAIAAYTKIKQNFSNTQIAREMDKYLAKLGVVND